MAVKVEKRRKKEFVFNGYGVSVCKDEKVLKMDRVGGCKTM